MPTLTDDERLAQEEPIAIATYETHVRPRMRPEDENKYVVFTLDTGEYEVDDREWEALNRLRTRRPGARMWSWRVGWQSTYYIRGHRRAGDA